MIDVDQQKPALNLLKHPLTLEQYVQLFKNLSGRDPSPEETERLRQRLAKKQAQRADQ